MKKINEIRENLKYCEKQYKKGDYLSEADWWKYNISIKVLKWVLDIEELDK